ncbi:MAG TPA: ABC transporter ATP-binding protein [Thermodesulfobacteriota bacterium]|jgi:branched-chain amino acid transport system ATP-binding protein|nr:ABC transporter ATP-binding protein [Thermodesulfobacteriota bacterium]
MLLEAKNVTVAYDTAVVLDGVSLGVHTGELLSIVGPNGAGKTTLLRTLCGLMSWEREMKRGMRKEVSNIIIEGEIVFEGEPINSMPAHQRAEKGLILCPEGGRPFRELTVFDNLITGAFLIKEREKIRQRLEAVFKLFPRLEERKRQMSGTLSGGERTMLAIGRALMSEPKLLLIDEPSLGLAPIVKDEVFKRIEDVYQTGVTIILVEQDVGLALTLARRNYVLSQGKVVFEGTSEALQGDERIRKTFLGL